VIVFIPFSVSIILCVVLCACCVSFDLAVILCDACNFFLCLIVLPLPPGRNPFAVKSK
jgi:hypothetical protein